MLSKLILLVTLLATCYVRSAVADCILDGLDFGDLEECGGYTVRCNPDRLTTWNLQSVARQGCSSTAPAYLAYTSCSQSPFLAKAGSSASASWVFNETGAYYSHWSGGGGDCLRKRRRNLLDSATAAEYSLGNLKAKTQDGSCTLGVKASGGTQSCLNTSVSLEKTSKPVRFGVRWVSKGKRYPFEHPPGEYQVFVYSNTSGCQLYLGVAPGCTDTKLQWYREPQGNLTDWKFLPSPGPATPPAIVSASSKPAPAGDGQIPEFKFADPATGPKPNSYVIDLKIKENFYNGTSFLNVASARHFQMSKTGSVWGASWWGAQVLQACTPYTAKIRKGFSLNQQLGKAECEIASTERLDQTCDDNRDFSFAAFKYETPGSATKGGKTAGCGPSAIKLRLLKNRKCATSGTSTTEYAAFTNAACDSAKVTVSTTSSLNKWVLNVTGNGYVTIRAKATAGTTPKCKGAYLAPKPNCQDAGVVLQSTPYKWSMYRYNIPNAATVATALVAPSKAKTCLRILGVSTSCTSSKLSLSSESSTTAAIAWRFAEP